jgi:hypothetical protein
MPSKANVSVAIDGIGVLMSIADAVPLLGAPVKGSLEALQKILEYSEVRLFQLYLLAVQF